MNYPQTAVSGRTTITKYWSNPLRDFEWKYGYIKDNPTDHNPFYSVPVPNTDFGMLKGFYVAMQASGNQFAFCPPGYQVGGTWPVTAISISGNVVTFTATGAGTALASKIGFPIQVLNTGNSSINGQYMYVTSTTGANTVVCDFTTGSGTTGSGGIITIGEVLASPDANDNVELTFTIGSYPNFTGQAYAGTVVPVVESVQLIDTATLNVYDGNGNNINGDFTLASPNSITPPVAYAPYVGYVLQFGTNTITTPITASYSMYYLCRFGEDMQEYENYISQIWLASSVKFSQVRI
jgi:hypothetical protein